MLAFSREKDKNTVLWLWRAEFGAVALCLCAVMARLMVREAGALIRQAAAEDWLLLAGSLAAAGRVVLVPWVGVVDKGWIWMFAVTCATHLAVKGFRATRAEN